MYKKSVGRLGHHGWCHQGYNIQDYLSRNTNNYVDEQEVVGEHRIFIGQYYGISAAFKLEEPIIAPDIRDLVFLSNND